MMENLTEPELSPETKQLIVKKFNATSYLESIKGITAVVILYTASATCVQLLERRIPDLELNTFRCGIPLIFYSLGLLMMQRWPIIDRSEIGVTLLYSLAGSSSKMGEFVAVTFLPAAAVSCLYSTSTIIFGLLLFSLLLKEAVTVKKVLFAVMCVCGVILVAQPWMELRTYDNFIDRGNLSENGIKDYSVNIIGHQEVNASQEPTASETSTVKFTNNSIGTDLVSEIVGYIAAVSGGILMASEVIIVKRNPYIKEHIVDILFWGWSICTAISLILTFIIETPMLPSNWFDVSMVTIHSVTCAAIWPLMMYQTKMIAGNTATLILSTQVVFMLISQYTMLSSILPGHRNWMEVIGVVLVLFGSSLSSLLEIVADTKLASCCPDK